MEEEEEQPLVAVAAVEEAPEATGEVPAADEPLQRTHGPPPSDRPEAALPCLCHTIPQAEEALPLGRDNRLVEMAPALSIGLLRERRGEAPSWSG